MNKKILYATAMAMVTTSAFGFKLWTGDTEKVNTEMDNDTKTAGYWFDYSDKNDGGLSSVTWPVNKGTEYDKNSLQPVIDFCQGVCGDFTLSKGEVTYNPFIGLGFNVVGETSKTDKTTVPGDATAWGGICIAYSCTHAPTLEMGLGDEVDASLGYDTPVKQLPKASDGKVVDVPWSEFEQSGWGTGEITSAAAAAQLVAVKFKIQGDDQSTGKFRISQIGPYQSGCQYVENPGAVSSVRSASNVKALVSGRTLSFSGIASDASVEVINLQGRVVMKGMVKGASSLDLSSVDAGVYMVRVSGKAVDFSNKIILK